MIFFQRLFAPKKPAASRRVLDIETVRVLLKHAIEGRTQSNYRDIWSKSKMATITAAEVTAASLKAYKPWREHSWECEDQARSLVEVAQRKAADEGMTWAIGILFADPPNPRFDGPRHVYVWAVVSSSIVFYDPTAVEWCECPENIYFSLA